MSSKQKLEKQLETALDNLIQKLEDIKASIINLLLKLENGDQVVNNWPSILDSFALITSNFSALNRYLKNIKGPNLKNFAFLPILLEPEINSSLETLTEGRVKAFNHEVVPNYMRTKLDPEIEFRDSHILQKSSQISPEIIQKQTNTLNKISTSVNHHLTTLKESLASDTVTQSMKSASTPSPAEVQKVLLALNYGYGISSPSQSLAPVNPSYVSMK